MKIKNLFINDKYNSDFDSMCYDSGTIMAECDIDDYKISIEVRGEVNVEYKGETYRHASDMPKELLEGFRDESYSQDTFLGLVDDLHIYQNNWHEVFIYNNKGEFLDSFTDDFIPEKDEVYEYLEWVLEDYLQWLTDEEAYYDEH